jgi:hypothetical protein
MQEGAVRRGEQLVLEDPAKLRTVVDEEGGSLSPDALR